MCYSDDSRGHSENLSIEHFRTIGKIKNDPIYDKIFSFCTNNRNTFDHNRFLHRLKHLGLSLRDPRLSEIEKNIEICQNEIIDHAEQNEHIVIDFTTFKGIISCSIDILKLAFENELAISDFPSFRKEIQQIYQKVFQNTDGEITQFTKYLRDMGKCNIVLPRDRLLEGDQKICILIGWF